MIEILSDNPIIVLLFFFLTLGLIRLAEYLLFDKKCKHEALKLEKTEELYTSDFKPFKQNKFVCKCCGKVMYEVVK